MMCPRSPTRRWMVTRCWAPMLTKLEPSSTFIGGVAAGEAADTAVVPGTAMKIMTGAPMPRGADTVVRVEDTTVLDGRVRIEVAVEPGKSVRHPGSDVTAGETLFASGTRTGPAHVGVMATVGVTTVDVAQKPKVAVFVDR